MPPFPFREVACVETPASPELVVEEAYWRVNPGIRGGGMPAAEHFRLHGARQDRKQAINDAGVRDLREQKLARLRFRRPPNPGRRPGEAANFLSDTLVSEFRIPQNPPVSSHEYGSFLADMQREQPDALFLDVGAGLRPLVTSNMVNMDLLAAVSTDVVCVGEDMPFEDEQFDFVLCAAALEHTRRPWDVAREICRVLKPGGMVRIDYPFISPVHGYPSHYFNATPEGAISLFEQACDIQSSSVEPNNHPIHALWCILDAWQQGLASADRTAFHAMTIGDLLGEPVEVHLASDFCRNLSTGTQRIIPAGSTLVAVKKPAMRRDPAPDLDAEIALLREELRVMRASTFWRVTQPARTLVARWRGRG